MWRRGGAGLQGTGLPAPCRPVTGCTARGRSRAASECWVPHPERGENGGGISGPESSYYAGRSEAAAGRALGGQVAAVQGPSTRGQCCLGSGTGMRRHRAPRPLAAPGVSPPTCLVTPCPQVTRCPVQEGTASELVPRTQSPGLPRPSAQLLRAGSQGDRSKTCASPGYFCLERGFSFHVGRALDGAGERRVVWASCPGLPSCWKKQGLSCPLGQSWTWADPRRRDAESRGGPVCSLMGVKDPSGTWGGVGCGPSCVVSGGGCHIKPDSWGGGWGEHLSGLEAFSSASSLLQGAGGEPLTQKKKLQKVQ